MAELTVTQIALTGATLSTASAAGGGDTFDNFGDCFLYVANGGGGSINVTLTAQAGPDGNTVADRVVAVGAGVTKLIGPIDPRWFNDSSGEVNVAYSGVTTVTVAALRL